MEAKGEEKISELKAKVAAVRPELPVECLKLICSGKILADDSTVSDSGYASSNFIVAMATKAKPKSEAPAPAAAPVVTPAPAPVPAPVPAVAAEVSCFFVKQLVQLPERAFLAYL